MQSRYEESLAKITSLLSEPKSVDEGFDLLQQLKLSFMQHLDQIDYRQFRLGNEENLNLIKILLNILELEISVKHKVSATITLNRLTSMLFQCYTMIDLNEKEKKQWQEISLDAFKRSIVYSDNDLSFLKQYLDLMQYFAFNMRASRPEEAERLYLEVLSGCDLEMKEYKYQDKIVNLKSSCYEGLGAIYLAYVNETTNANEIIKSLKVSFQYYENALTQLSLISDPEKEKKLAHMLTTISLKLAQYHNDIYKVGSIKDVDLKLKVVGQIANFYLDAIKYSEKYNEFRKLGNAKFQFGMFQYYNNFSFKKSKDECIKIIEEGIERLLQGLALEKQINKEQYDILFKEYHEIQNKKLTSDEKMKAYKQFNKEVFEVSKNNPDNFVYKNKSGEILKNTGSSKSSPTNSNKNSPNFSADRKKSHLRFNPNRNRPSSSSSSSDEEIFSSKKEPK